MKKVLLLALLPMMLLAGCSKDETIVDPRDQYVGNYSWNMVGSITAYYAGEVMLTVPQNGSGSNATISKSGDNDLNIDGMIMTLSGNRLLPVTILHNENEVFDNGQSVSMTGTSIVSGTASVGIITLDVSYSGTWIITQGGTQGTGPYSGAAVMTLTKR